jgi:hypothetical protein
VARIVTVDIEDAVARLHDRLTRRRAAGAKQLRSAGDPSAGPELLAALRRELQDPRTWETAYQMIMAIGACQYRPAVGDLQQIARSSTVAAVRIAVGDAVMRLDRDYDSDSKPMRWCLDSQDDDLVNGALQATATLRLPLSPETIDAVVGFLASHGPYDGIRFWAAVAAVDWTGKRAQRFLQDCVRLPREDVAEAAAASLRGEYRSYPIP